MSDPMTIAATGLASFNHVTNLVKLMLNTRDGARDLSQWNNLQAEIASIQTGYLALTQQNMTLLAEKDDLKKEIARFETWETERERYELKEVAPEVFAFVIKESAKGTEPIHWLCCHCYNQGKKEILCLSNPSHYEKTYACHGCNKEISFKNPNYQEPYIAHTPDYED